MAWIISAVKEAGDGRSLWYNESVSDLGSLSMATIGMNEKIG